MMKLNILHTASNTQWGGQERRIYNECKWMKAKGHTVAIATRSGSPLYEKAREEGWQTFDISFNGLTAISTIIRFRSIYRTFQPHILNTHGNMDAKLCLLAAKGMGIPLKILSRHITPAVKNSWYNRMLYDSFSDIVFTTADCARDQIVRDLNIPSDKVHTVSSGIVTPESLMERARARDVAGQALGIPGKRRFIGYVGRLDPDKGLSDLINAFTQIQNDLPDHDIILVGEGGAEDELRQLVKQLHLEKRVHFAGYQADPWPWYRAFDCSVLVSRENEGIPQTLLEAMFAQTAVIGTDVGGIPDIIDHGKTGILCPPKNPDELSRAILDTLTNQEATRFRVKNASALVSKAHTIDAMGQKILNILEEKLTHKL